VRVCVRSCLHVYRHVCVCVGIYACVFVGMYESIRIQVLTMYINSHANVHLRSHTLVKEKKIFSCCKKNRT
jgi:hypothetical protein